jgi:hypothetical protein
MSRFKVILRQPRYRGGRIPVHSAFIPGLEQAIQREMARFGVSRSFVIATATAFALGVDDQPDYKKLREGGR